MMLGEYFIANELNEIFKNYIVYGPAEFSFANANTLFISLEVIQSEYLLKYTDDQLLKYIEEIINVVSLNEKHKNKFFIEAYNRDGNLFMVCTYNN